MAVKKTTTDVKKAEAKKTAGPATEKPAKAAAAAKPAGKTVKAPAAGDKPNALQQPLTPSKELAEIVGSDQLPRGQVVSKVWEYIKAHGLQDDKDKRVILADAKLKPIFGKDKVTMFEMNKYLAQHLKA